MNRREFLKYTSASLASLTLPPCPELGQTSERLAFRAPPASLGRIATWWRQAVRTEPSAGAEWVAWKTRNDVIPLLAAVIGEAPWPSNPVWYQTEGGFIHSGYVQPVENAPSAEVIPDVVAPGFWAEVCVPMAEARWRPTSPYVSYRLYYGTVYRVVGAVTDDEGNWWYQLRDGVTYVPGPYVPASSVRRIPPDELAPISLGRPDKSIRIDIDAQMLTCFEGESEVFRTRVSSGLGGGLATPRGEHRVLYKRHTRRMTGGDEDDRYDLPGVAFPVYITWSAVAIHGTYWHNDYGRRHSHGCVNVTNQDAQWVFRWTDPVVPYDEYERRATPEESTPVVVI